MACGKVVDGDGVKLQEKLMMMKEKAKEQEKVYHRHYLTCSRRTKAILGKFFPIGGAAVCHSCAEAKVRCNLLVLQYGRVLEVEDDTCNICGRAVGGDCLLS